MVALVVVDLVMTILHPSARGPLSELSRRLAWRLLLPLGRRAPGRVLLTWVGPSALAANLAVWVGGLWLAFALVYMPFVGELAYAPSVEFGRATIVDALYLSGVTLTTVGFGDVVAGHDALRLVTILESASGFAVMTGAVTYVLSVLPVVARTRSTAEVASNLNLADARSAAILLRSDGWRRAGELHREIVSLQQALWQFPVLFYFVPRRERESPYGLVRAAVTVCNVLRAWDAKESDTWVEVEARGLEAALRGVVEVYEREFGGLIGRPARAVSRGTRGSPGDGGDDFPGEAEALLESLRRLYGHETAATRRSCREPGR